MLVRAVSLGALAGPDVACVCVVIFGGACLGAADAGTARPGAAGPGAAEAVGPRAGGAVPHAAVLGTRGSRTWSKKSKSRGSMPDSERGPEGVRDLDAAERSCRRADL